MPLPAHGVTPMGLVCISPSVTSCPQARFTFNATSGSPLSVNVNYDGPVGAPAYNAFDISVFVPRADLDVRNPSTSNVTVSSSFPIIAQECIEGVPVTGTCSLTDGPGVVHVVAAVIGSGDNANRTLFTIHYTVAGNTAGIGILFLNGQTGAPDGACSNTSASDHATCVTLVNSTTGNPDPVNIETADFTNLTPTANFAVTPITGLAPLTVAFDASLSKPITATTNTILSYNWAFGDGMTANVTGAMTAHTYSTSGAYNASLYVLDTGGIKSEIKFLSTVLIQVRHPDFRMVASPSSFTGSQTVITGGPSRNSTINITSLDQFSGTILLSVKLNTTIPNAPTATLSQTSVILKAGTTNSSTQLTLKAAQTTQPGGYEANVTGTSGTLVNHVFVDFTVSKPDFSVSLVSPPTVTIPQGGSNGQISIAITRKAGFNGTVNLSTTQPIGLIASMTPSTITLDASMTQVSSTLGIAVLSGTIAGNYVVTVIGTSGPLSHNVNETVVVPSTDFIITSSPRSFSIQAGTSSNATIILTGIKGYSSTSSSPFIVLKTNSSSTLGIKTTPTPGSVSIATPNGFAAATLIITTAPSTPAGSYTISVNATDATISRYGNITVIVTAPVASVQLGAIILSTTTTTAGNIITMNITVTNTRAGSVQVTVFMSIFGGTGGNLTVDHKTLNLTSTQPQIVTLTWDTHNYNPGTYHVYAGIIGAQTTSINQSASAGNVSIGTQAQTGNNLLTNATPWISIAEAAVIAVLAALLILRRRRTATA